ncbi:MAG TPA: AsmA family protein [Terriglobales bacterium]|jgi:hypothetical protein
MTRGWGWRGAGLAVVVLLAGWLLVPLITLHGAQARILSAIQAGLGRRVQADTVRLRLFPQPGVELDDVRLADDPAFGAEDMVVADDATAAVRVLPLFAGRLEFASIHLDDASINLVRNRAGRWNIAALLERASRPGRGGARGPGVAPFPYLDWSGARINFKLDQTKTRLYLDQVQGSLARDDQGWRLQTSFVPGRTDLNLSNTGNVTLDGRWPAATGTQQSYRQRPFSVEVRLGDSYLAASSALLAGHDAGVHGVLAAQMHIAPATNSDGLLISGTAAVQALRRWDLMPPPVSLQGSFAGIYWPAQDRFELTGLGDPGWQQVRISGGIQNVFSGPSLDLHAAVNGLPAASLWPLAVALKSGLPAHAQLTGAAAGTAGVQWSPWDARHRQPQVAADLALSGLTLSSGQEQIQVPEVRIAGRGSQLQLAPVSAAITAGSAGAVPVTLSAQADPNGFHVKIAAASLTRPASQSLDRLLGLHSRWPTAVSGVAQVRLDLSGRWSALREVGWSGFAMLSKARFQPPDGPGLDLTGVRITYADPLPAKIALTAQLPGAALAAQAGRAASVPARLAVTLEAPAASQAPWQFTARARQLDATALWQWLQPPSADLMQRVFGANSPTWTGSLRAQGTVSLDDVNWHGRHAAVAMQLAGAAGAWQASDLSLQLAGGEFAGRGQLRDGQYAITGAVPASRPLDLQTLLTGTPYQDWAGGSLSGTLQLVRPSGSLQIAAVQAEGDFDLRDGRLATAAGERRFQRFSGHYALAHGSAQLTDVVWIAEGERWQGQGSARAGLQPGPQLVLDLRPSGSRRTTAAAARHLHLRSAPLAGHPGRPRPGRRP